MIAAAVFRGLRKGLHTTLTLAKAVVPAYVAVSLLARTPVLDWLGGLATPWLSVLGLPGEAALPLLLGMFVSLYSGIGALASLELGAREATIVAVVLGVAHSLVIETAVTRQIGVASRFPLTLRIGLGLAMGALLHRVWGG
ncbi:MAG: nucleoside recognition protein [Firmicutes bacterium]|nr:nucleoside recognition protein [Bacillota bacterium]